MSDQERGYVEILKRFKSICEEAEKGFTAAVNTAETCQGEVDHLQKVLDEKCDELKEALIENGRLRLLLDQNNIEHLL